MFEFNNVSFMDILHIDNLTIESNKTTAIIGPSGSGKSTLLRLLNKLISPTEGFISYNGHDISSINSTEYRRKVPMLSQSPIVYPGNIKDNLLIGRKFQQKNLLYDEILKKALKNVKLDKGLEEDISKLSGGEQQRVSIARLMLLDADAYLLDEPSSALDDLTEDFVIKTMIDLAKDNNKTIIFVTHSREMANKYADRIIQIKEGMIANEWICD